MEEVCDVPFKHAPVKLLDNKVLGQQCIVEICQTIHCKSIESRPMGDVIYLEVNKGWDKTRFGPMVEIIPIYSHMWYQLKENHHPITEHLLSLELKLYWRYHAEKVELKHRRSHSGEAMYLVITPLTKREVIQTLRVDRLFQYRVIKDDF